ncbi:MAG: multidrug efflux RND transporter permease subunit [Myxococcales bacterium]|nr:multidrug efflux RND transporter permease subunit [Myxococcales bacterium]
MSSPAPDAHAPAPAAEPKGNFFVRRPIVAMVISIITVIVGLVSMSRLPIAQFPEMVPPMIKISGTYTGADALTVEQSVATPIEQQVNGVERMIYMQSTNSADGKMALNVSFEVGADIDISNVLANTRVNIAMPQLPPEVKQTGVSLKKSLAMPLIVVSLFSPNNTWDASFLSNYAVINVNDQIARIKGVGEVAMYGSSDYAMRIWVKPDRLARLGLTVGDLQNAIKKQNVVNPAGKLGGEPAPKGQEMTYVVRAQGRLVTAQEFEEVVVKENADGSLVRLKDVSRIEIGTQNYDQRGRFNGQSAGVITIFQAPGSNALEVANNVKATMAKLKANFPQDMEYDISLDTTLPITEGINEIAHTFVEAVVLVILVVFIFLQGFRATLIPLLTVPVSLVGAFALFPLFGFSINTLTLLGLVLAIGIVVDDAIVVVEAVEHHIEHGLEPKAATNKAMSEVSGPVIAIALVLSAVFIPVAFVGGITGRMYQQFAITIAISVMLSAINALTLSPALCGMLLRPKKEGKGLLARFFKAFNTGFTKATNGYGRVTNILLRKGLITTAILLVFFGGAGFLGSKLPGGFVPEEDQGYLLAVLALPPASSLQRADEVAKQVEELLEKTDGVKTYNTIVGLSIATNTSSTYLVTFFIQLEDWAERVPRGRTADVIMREINGQLAKMPETAGFAFGPPAIPGIGTGSGFSIFVQDTVGRSTDELALQTQKFIDAAKKRPEFSRVGTSWMAAVPQVFVDVDREKMMKQGVEPSELYGALQTFMGSSYINDFNRFGRQWRVYLAAEPEYRATTNNIGDFYVRNKEGFMVPVSSVANVRTINGPEYTTRFNLYRGVEVTGQPAPGVSSGQAMKALEEVAKQTLDEGYQTSWNAMSYQEATAPSSVPTFLMAILLVFLILAAQYESWALPFSVLLVVPVAVVGAFLGLFLNGLDFNVFGQVGLIMLVGLAAKNAILVVEFAKMKVDSGMPLLEATLEGAKLRLRPILMTAFAFILGCIPLLRAAGAGAASRVAIGAVVVFGMLMATFIGIFLTPGLFVLVERLKAFTSGDKEKAKIPAAAGEKS